MSLMNFNRWKLNVKQTPVWLDRVKLIASMIPAGASVVDIGAGSMHLKRFLDHPSEYQPVDGVKSSRKTLVQDFNQSINIKLPRKFDYAVCSGLFEYITAYHQFLNFLGKAGHVCIFSYATTDLNPNPVNRKRCGWLNHFSFLEITQLLTSQGFKITNIMVWQNQHIFILQPPAAIGCLTQQLDVDMACFHRIDYTNTGDNYAGVSRYFPLNPLFTSDILVIPPTIPKKVIIGGGGLLGSPTFSKSINQLLQYSQVKIGWGLGLNQSIDTTTKYLPEAPLAIPSELNQFDLLGLRDYIPGTNWVPCVSCMHPLFDAYWPELNDIVVFEHKRVPLHLSEFPTMNNSQQDIAVVLAFIGSAKTIITNSYHGAYWAQLLGKRLIVVPFASKFYHFKHKPLFATPSTVRTLVHEATAYPATLSECRKANLEFFQKVQKLLA